MHTNHIIKCTMVPVLLCMQLKAISYGTFLVWALYNDLNL